MLVPQAWLATDEGLTTMVMLWTMKGVGVGVGGTAAWAVAVAFALAWALAVAVASALDCVLAVEVALA